MQENFRANPGIMNKEITKNILKEIHSATIPYLDKVNKILIKNKDTPLETSEAMTSALKAILQTLAQNQAKNICICIAYRIIEEESININDNKEVTNILNDKKRPTYIG